MRLTRASNAPRTWSRVPSPIASLFSSLTPSMGSVISHLRPQTSHLTLLTKQQDVQSVVSQAPECVSAVDGESVLSDVDETCGQSAEQETKRQRQEQATRPPQQKGSRGKRKRRKGKQVVEDMSDMYDVLDLKLECGLCRQQFRSNAQLVCHQPCYYQRKGMTLPPVQWRCPECPKYFNKLGVLRQHMEAHCEGHYSCKKCDARAIRRSLIIQHIRTEHLQ